MITARQKREPAVAAVELCSDLALAARNLREFAILHPEKVKAAQKLFPEYQRDFDHVLAAASQEKPA